MTGQRTPAQERAALALLERAFEHAEGREAAYIQSSRDEPDVKARAMELLAVHNTSEAAIQTGGAASLDTPQPDPERIGVYDIIECLGRGGMGAVYLGQRAAGDFTHKAAIKVIKPGLMSDTLAEKFRRERQLLASLHHPNIAQLYDGGEAEDGTPYFIMEYVEGLSIPRWLEAENPPQAERLRLFLEVCDAVEFAHQSLVVHRDLTPSNVLVTKAGQAKLIDFGIAKPPTGGSSGISADVSIGSLSLTPGFAAPERARSSVSTTLTDIYSLGRILSVLIADCHNAELDAIANQASAEDPDDRYATARALAQDIRNYQKDLPVHAYSKSAAYHARKFFKRNALAVIGGVLILGALIGGLITSTLAYREADSARTDAMARFEDVRDLAKFQLFDLYDQMSRVAGNTAARGDIAAQAQVYLKQLAARPDAPPDVLLDTAAGYIRLGRIMGVPARPSLGEPDQAAKHLSSALDLLDEYQAAGHPLAERFWSIRANALAARAVLGTHEDMTMDKARADLDEAAGALEQVSKNKRGADWYGAKRQLLFAEVEHADLSSDAEALFSLADQIATNAKNWPEGTLSARERAFDAAYAHHVRGVGGYVAGNHEGAMEQFTEADAAFDQLDAQEKNDPVVLYLQAWNNYIAYGSAAQLQDLDKVSYFIEKSQRVTDRLKQIEERDAMVRGMDSRLREARAQYLADIGDLDGAIQVQQDIIDHYASQMSRTGQQRHAYNVSYSRIVMAFLKRDAGDLKAACAELEAAEVLIRPAANTRTLPSFMAKAAQELPGRIALCRNGEDIGRQMTMFEDEDWGGE